MPLLLASWNVAAWETTLKYIKEHYGSLEAYLDRHQIDILALQEVKVTRQKLSDNAGKALCAHSLAGWDSYWSCSKRGFNGVTTFVRKGLACAGTATPLGDEALDGEARALLTDHGSFVLFNVYAHSTGEDPTGVKLARKLAFLEALAAEMQAQRAAGKQVILCGDLNIAARGIDVPWRQCMLPMPALLDAPLLRREAGAATCDALREEFGQRLRLPMHELEKALERHGLADPSSSASAAAAPEAAHAAPEAAPAAPASAKARLEALLKQLWVELGQSNSSPRSLAWLARLLEPTDEGGAGGVGGAGAPLMVDAFAALRPRHRARATAWCQYTNKRYSNCGRRIDYFLVDAPLFAAHALAGGPLAEDEDEAGALRAATAGGRWLPAPFGGGGLPMVTMRVHDTQFCAPHTGIVYSPPHASDHVMVTLLLADDAIAPRPLPARAPPDEATRACTFRPPKTLASFFAKKPAPAADEGGEKRQKVG